MKRPLLGKTDKIPPGWFTRRDLENKWGIGACQVNKILTEGLRNGSVKCTKFKIRTGTGRIYPTPHYRQK